MAVLLGEWGFASDDLIDSSGNGHDATFAANGGAGGLTYVDGPLPSTRAAVFGNELHAINLGRAGLEPPINGVTTMGWMRLPTGLSASQVFTLLCKARAASSSRSRIGIQGGGAPDWAVRWSDDLHFASGGATLTAGQWHHLAMVDGPNSWAVYVNGTSLAGAARSAGAGIWENYPWTIGRSTDVSDQWAADGMAVSMVRIFDGELTQAEVQTWMGVSVEIEPEPEPEPPVSSTSVLDGLGEQVRLYDANGQEQFLLKQGETGGLVTRTIAEENQLSGTPRSEWDLVAGAWGGISTLQGFADGFSFNRDEVCKFKIAQSNANGWIADVYRLGWYGGNGAHHYGMLVPNGTQLAASQSQPAPLDSDAITTLPSLDCSNWSETLEWEVPEDVPSGVFLLKLTEVEGSGSSHVMFVVRDDQRYADLMVMLADSTWVAYNAFGGVGPAQTDLLSGNSLYYGSAVNQYASDCARFVSYDRPFVNRAACNAGQSYGAVEWSNFFTGEYGMIRFLERNGIDAKYYSCLDAAGDPDGLLLNRVNAAMLVGHNEYWSDNMRSGWEAFKAGGGNVFSSSGNEVFWRTVGHEPDSQGRPRQMECYKSTIAERSSASRPQWTGTWRDKAGAGRGGNHPENLLTGTIFGVNGTDFRSLRVPVAGNYHLSPIWRGTAVAELTSGEWVGPAQGVGFEWDTYGPAGTSSATAAEHMAEPIPGTQYASHAEYTVSAGLRLTDAGDIYEGGGTVAHRLVIAPSGAFGGITFGTGTVNWPLMLDPQNTYHGVGSNNESAVIQQATLNILADMGCLPETVQSGLAIPTPHEWSFA